jgi:hypothetical protein
MHNPIKVGTLGWLLGQIAAHHGTTSEELVRSLKF